MTISCCHADPSLFYIPREVTIILALFCKVDHQWKLSWNIIFGTSLRWTAKFILSRATVWVYHSMRFKLMDANTAFSTKSRTMEIFTKFLVMWEEKIVS